MTFVRRIGQGPHPRISSLDPRAQRELNATAPVVPRLNRRILGTFAPYTRTLLVTAVVVVLAGGATVVNPLLVREVFDAGLFPASGDGPHWRILLILLGALMVVAIVNEALNGVQNYLTTLVGNRVTNDLRKQLFRHLQHQDVHFFTSTRAGEVQSRLNNDIGAVSTILSTATTSVLANAVVIIAAFVSMLVMSWPLALVTMGLTPILVFFQVRIGQRRAGIATATQDSFARMNAISQDALSINGVLLARTFGREGDEAQRYDAESDRNVVLQVRQLMTGRIFFALVQIALAAIPVGIYLIAGMLIADGTGAVTAGTIVAFTTIQARLSLPLISLMRVSLEMQTSRAIFARIFHAFDTRPNVADVPGAADLDLIPGRPPTVEFRDVTFRYPDADAGRATLDSVNVAVGAGEFVALVGHSGSGKTTLGYLLARFYDPGSGAVLINGRDIRAYRQHTVRAHLGIVTQETYLFHDTIAANLRYAAPDAELEDVIAAAKAASIHDTIMSFPDGYDTVVGERGYRLSGGEQQRIAIARVILKDPAILLLDEATSSLDNRSERVVQDSLFAAARGRTTIAIAHRLSTIVDADRIVVFDRGRVVESGTHDELLAREGHYRRLYLALQRDGDRERARDAGP